MSRYAGIKELKQIIYDNVFGSDNRNHINELIDAAPSIDIVRCVECRYKGMEICPMYKLTKAGVLKPYDFCSYGERSEKPNNSND